MRQSLFILGSLNDADIDWLTAAGRRMQLTPGSNLVTQGRPIDAIYLVLDGRLSVTIEAGGQRTTLRELGAGEVIGEISLLESRPPSASVTAVTAASVLAVPRRELEAHLRSDTGFGSRFYRALAVMLAQRLRTATARGTSEQDEADELDPAVLEQVELAAARFRWIMQRMGGA